MQEIKAQVRSFFIFIKRPMKRIFRALPMLERIIRSLFRRYPKLALFYLRLVSSSPMALSSTGILEATDGHATTMPEKQMRPARRRALTPRASLILTDLKAATHSRDSDCASQTQRGSL